jgi:WD40 repeat protein
VEADLLLAQCRADVRSWDYRYLAAARDRTGLRLPGRAPVAFHPDGTRLAVSSLDGAVKLMDVADGRELETIRPSPTKVRAAPWDPRAEPEPGPDPEGDNRVAMFGRRIYSRPGERLTLLSFSPDGKHLLVGVVPVKPWEAKVPIMFPHISIDGKEPQQASPLTEALRTPSGKDGRRGDPPSGRLEVWDIAARRLAFSVQDRDIVEDGEAPRCEFSPEGRLLAIPHQKTIEVRDLASGQEVLTVDVGEGTLARVAFSPDGTEIIGAMLDSIRVWDTRTGRVRSSVPLERPIAQYAFVAFSPRRDRIASGEDRVATVWETNTGRALLRLEGDQDVVTTIAFSPDGSWIATASSRRVGTSTGDPHPALIVWDARTGRRLHSLIGHSLSTSLAYSHAITGLEFSPDSRYLASADHQYVRRWRIPIAPGPRTLSGHADAVTGVAFSPDGTHLATSGRDKTVRLWDVAGGQVLRTLEGHTAEVLCVAFSGDGRHLASAATERTFDARDMVRVLEKHELGDPGEIIIWDAIGGKALRTLGGGAGAVTCLAFRPHSDELAWASADEGFDLRLMSSLSDASRIPAEGKDLIIVAAVGQVLHFRIFDGEGKVVVDTSEKGLPAQAHRIEALRGQLQGLWPPHKLTRIEKELVIPAVTSIVGHTPDEVGLSFYGLRSGRRRSDFKTKSGPTIQQSIRAMAFNGDGTRLALVGDLDGPRVLDAESGWEVGRYDYDEEGSPDATVAFSPDGRYLASGGELKVWDTLSGQCVFARKRGEEPEERVASTAVVFSPDGKRLVAGGGDGLITVWDLETGQETLRLKGHTGLITSLTFSPDGTRLASASEDRTVKLW